jgi:hypothetical protein
MKGAFDRLQERGKWTCLLQDCTVQFAGDDELFIGHTWLQDAGTLLAFDLETDDRIAFSTLVTTYTSPAGEEKIGFRSPTRVIVEKRPVALRVPSPVVWKSEPSPSPVLVSKQSEPLPDATVFTLAELRKVTSLIGELGKERLLQILNEL